MTTFNRTRAGRKFSDTTVNAVWRKASLVPGCDAALVRADRCGATIHRHAYGQTTTYGWEIDHIRPVSKGGSDDLSNLQPLQWRNNRGKGDDHPRWYCTVTT